MKPGVPHVRIGGQRLRTSAELRRALRDPRLRIRLAVFLHDRDAPLLFPASKADVRRSLAGKLPHTHVRATIVGDCVIVGVPSLLVPSGQRRPA